MISLKKFGSRHRKTLHFVLLTSIIIMQIVLLAILYHDKKNDSKAEILEKELKNSLNAKNTFNYINRELYESEEDLNRYFKTHELFFLRQYYAHTDSIRYIMSSFSNYVHSNHAFLDKHKSVCIGDLIFYSQKSHHNKFLSFKNEARILEIKRLGIISRRMKLLAENDTLLNEYNKTVGLLKEKTKLDLKKEYHNDKELRNFLLVLVLIVTLLLIVFTKITFRYEEHLKKAKKKIQTNLKFKDRIVGMISHEIRSPLNIISLYCKLLEKKIKDQELKDSIRAIQFTINSISLMSDQVLSMLKSENKKLQLNPITFNLNEKLRFTLLGLKDIAKSAGNKLTLNLNITPDIVVDSDLIKIQQLFCNIIGNANKFTNKGEIEVFANCIDISPEKYKLEARIKDNGIGMSKRDLENVFASYYQGEISEDLQNLGMGLGLNLCRELVEIFSGEIQIKSEINVGTEVSFILFLNKYKTETCALENQSINQDLIMA